MEGKIKRKIEADGSVRLHEAVSDSVYMRGEGLEARTLTEFARPHRISLLHMSDNHNSTAGIGVMSALLASANNDDVLGVNTGDVEGYSSVSTTLEASLSAMATHNAGHVTRPILLVKGNHDARDTTSGTGTNRESTATGYITRVNGNAVTYGKVDSTNKGYWYKDVTHNGVKLRLIALDEYQYSVALPENGSNDSNRYSKVYSTDQVEWLEAVLKSTPSDTYIIMAHHQPLYSEHPTEVLNDFVHHGINGASAGSGHTYTNSMYTYREGNINLPARIVDAYIHKKRVAFTCVNGVPDTPLSVDVDFRDCAPAKFACHINGHVHGDYCEYHPEFPEQLCLTIGTDSPTISTWYDDLSRSESGEGHVINRVTIDADRDVVKVERIGASVLDTDKTWLIQDGSARKSIEFPIKAVEVEPEGVLRLKEAFAALDLDFEQFKSDYSNN